MTEPEYQEVNAFLDRIVDNCDSIYIRDTVNGRVDTYLLSELPVEQALKHMARFVRQHLRNKIG